VEIWLKDDTNDYRLVFSDTIKFKKKKIFILAYDEDIDEFVLR